MTLDPIAHGRAAAHATLAQDRRRFTVHDGGRQSTLLHDRRHVANLRPLTPTTLVDLSLPLQDVHLLLVALGQAAPTLQAVAERISGQMHPSLLPAWMDADDCNPHGMVRPS